MVGIYRRRIDPQPAGRSFGGRTRSSGSAGSHKPSRLKRSAHTYTRSDQGFAHSHRRQTFTIHKRLYDGRTAFGRHYRHRAYRSERNGLSCDDKKLARKTRRAGYGRQGHEAHPSAGSETHSGVQYGNSVRLGSGSLSAHSRVYRVRQGFDRTYRHVRLPMRCAHCAAFAFSGGGHPAGPRYAHAAHKRRRTFKRRTLCLFLCKRNGRRQARHRLFALRLRAHGRYGRR